jgi:hypothetical protein
MEGRDQMLREDQLVVEALRGVGVSVKSPQDLLRTREKYANAIPVLVNMISRVQTYTMKEIIARALSVREAKGHAEPMLIAEFEASLPDPGKEAESLRWAIANTFEILGGGRGVSSSLLRLLVDPRSGEARGMLSLALAKTKNRDAIPVLLQMLDGTFKGFAAEGLGILGAEQAIPRLRVMANEKNNTAWERRQATKALKRLGGTSEGAVAELPNRKGVKPVKKVAMPKPKKDAVTLRRVTLEEQLRVLAECGICLLPAVTPDALTRSFSRQQYEQEPYRLLLCVMGDMDEGDEKSAASDYLSNNIWHFDTECVEGDGSYVALAERMATLAQGDLPLENIEDHVEDGEVWLAFSMNGQQYKWNAKFDGDWVDPSIPPRFDELLGARNSTRRFTYINLGGQDCLIGCATPEERAELEANVGLQVLWLSA